MPMKYHVPTPLREAADNNSNNIPQESSMRIVHCLLIWDFSLFSGI
jgi:hypothetical protein